MDLTTTTERKHKPGIVAPKTEQRAHEGSVLRKKKREDKLRGFRSQKAPKEGDDFYAMLKLHNSGKIENLEQYAHMVGIATGEQLDTHLGELVFSEGGAKNNNHPVPTVIHQLMKILREADPASKPFHLALSTLVELTWSAHATLAETVAVAIVDGGFFRLPHFNMSNNMWQVMANLAATSEDMRDLVLHSVPLQKHYAEQLQNKSMVRVMMHITAGIFERCRRQRLPPAQFVQLAWGYIKRVISAFLSDYNCKFDQLSDDMQKVLNYTVSCVGKIIENTPLEQRDAIVRDNPALLEWMYRIYPLSSTFDQYNIIFCMAAMAEVTRGTFFNNSAPLTNYAAQALDHPSMHMRHAACLYFGNYVGEGLDNIKDVMVNRKLVGTLCSIANRDEMKIRRSAVYAIINMFKTLCLERGECIVNRQFESVANYDSWLHRLVIELNIFKVLVPLLMAPGLDGTIIDILETLILALRWNGPKMRAYLKDNTHAFDYASRLQNSPNNVIYTLAVELQEMEDGQEEGEDSFNAGDMQVETYAF